MRPVCVKCTVEMTPAKNDFLVEEMSDTEHSYRVWSTDLYRCPACRMEVVIGFAPEPWGEYWQENYAKKTLQADLRYWPRPDMVPTPQGVNSHEAENQPVFNKKEW